MLIVIGLFLFVVIGWNALACMHVLAMTRFVDAGTRTPAPEALSLGAKIKTLICGVRLPRPENSATPADLGMPYESLTIQSEADVSLGAWHMSAPGHRGLVILFHGYSSDKSALLEEANVFFDIGYDCLMIDFRGSGESSGKRTTVGYKEGRDVCATFAYAQQHFPNQPIYLFGQSMGAAAILRSIHTDALTPDGIILEAVFDTLLNTTRNRFNSMGIPSFPSAHLLTFWGGIVMGIDAFSHCPMEYAKAVTVPTIVLHGGSDPRARLEDGQRVFDALQCPKKMWVFEGLLHGSTVGAETELWRARMGAFLADPMGFTQANTERRTEA